ncbi:MAG: class I SAM-dependent methyltransferase [Methylophilaceae bacterium]|nr:class I SAM-dependent methyltransferase [Methylophilaceae bacterium]
MQISPKKPGDFGDSSTLTIVSSEEKNALKPATLALFIQCASFLLAMLASWSIHQLYLLPVNLFVFVLVQGSLALLISSAFGLAIWWCIIQFVFPFAALFMHGLQLPAGIYLAGFLLTLSLFWTTFRTQVPFYPSRLGAWQQIFKLLPQGRHIRMVDIGSGLGDLVMYMARAKPGSYFLGVEIAPLPWLISVVRKFFKKSNADFKLSDYHTLNFADFDVVFAYLSPAAMQALWEKAALEMSTGSLLISYEFEIPGKTPARVIRKDKNSPAIYVWQF